MIFTGENVTLDEFWEYCAPRLKCFKCKKRTMISFKVELKLYTRYNQLDDSLFEVTCRLGLFLLCEIN